MKKILMTTLLLLTVVMGLQAQSLIGTWGTPTETSDGEKSTIMFVFGQNGSLSMKAQIEVNDPEVGEIAMTVTIPGTYSRKGNTLTINLESKKADGKLDKLVLKKEMQDMLNANPEMKKTFDDLIKNEITKNIKKEFADSSPIDGETEIKELTATKLVLDDHDGEIMHFTRIK